MVPITVEGSSQSPGDQAHTVRKAPGLSAGVTVTYNAQHLSQQQQRFLSFSVMAFFFFSFLFQDTERAQRPNKHTSLCILCSATSDCASSQSHAAGSQLQGQPRGHYARSRMTPLSEPSRRWHFVGSTARLVSVPRKFSELSLVVLLGRAEDSSME